jgi:hypothetical protein
MLALFTGKRDSETEAVARTKGDEGSYPGVKER